MSLYKPESFEKSNNTDKKRKHTGETIVTTLGPSNKSLFSVDGVKYIDTDGGFLLEAESVKETNEKQITNNRPLIDDENHDCLECGNEFATSYLLEVFEYSVCDGCRENNDKYKLITRTEAKSQFLLKDCDFDRRSPKLKFIEKPNPHNERWGRMKLYLLEQVKERALHIWGSIDKIEEMHEQKGEKRLKTQEKKYAKNMEALRKQVRSSLYDRTTGPAHSHVFDPEVYDKESDMYSKKCSVCGLVESYEKM